MFYRITDTSPCRDDHWSSAIIRNIRICSSPAPYIYFVGRRGRPTEVPLGYTVPCKCPASRLYNYELMSAHQCMNYNQNAVPIFRNGVFKNQLLFSGALEFLPVTASISAFVLGIILCASGSYLRMRFLISSSRVRLYVIFIA